MVVVFFAFKHYAFITSHESWVSIRLCGLGQHG